MPRGNKYHARKEKLDGFTFDSIAEAERYRTLLLLQAAGEIERLEVHPRFVLQDAFTDAAGVRQRAIAYEGDFSYWQDGWRYVEDVKGAETPVFKLKRKMFLLRYPDLMLLIVKSPRRKDRR
jgi:hypothetical protein